MWAVAASTVPGATVSGGWRKMRSTSAASKRRMRWFLRMRAIVFSLTRTAFAGVGTCSHRSRNQLAAGSPSSPACGIVPPQLVAHPVGQAALLLLELFVHARPFAQLDHQRIIDRQAPERAPVGAQRMPQHFGIAAVVLGARHAEAITEAVELLGIDGKHLEVTLQQHLDHRPARRLDRHRDLLRPRPGRLEEPGAKLLQASPTMRHLALGNEPPLGFKKAGAMLLHCPIEADKPTKLVCHRFHLQTMAGHRDVRRSLYWRSRRKPSTGRRRGLSAGAQ